MKSLKSTLEITKFSRKSYQNILANYSLDQLNYIPPQFSNNLFWNIAHVVVTQQLLAYRLCGLPLLISEDWVKKYKRGTKVEVSATPQDLNDLKIMLFETIETTEKDIKLNKFKEVSPYKTSAGFSINTVEEAFEFNNFHEGIHLGYILALKKEVKKF